MNDWVCKLLAHVDSDVYNNSSLIIDRRRRSMRNESSSIRCVHLMTAYILKTSSFVDEWLLERGERRHRLPEKANLMRRNSRGKSITSAALTPYEPRSDRSASPLALTADLLNL